MKEENLIRKDKYCKEQVKQNCSCRFNNKLYQLCSVLSFLFFWIWRKWICYVWFDNCKNKDKWKKKNFKANRTPNMAKYFLICRFLRRTELFSIKNALGWETTDISLSADYFVCLVCSFDKGEILLWFKVTVQFSCINKTSKRLQEND